MTIRRICLFNSLQIFVGTSRAARQVEIRSKKLQKLIAYLVLNRKGPVDRLRLGELLWPDVDGSTARRYVREYIYRARQFMDELAPDLDLLHSDEQFVYFELPPGCTVDVELFSQLIQQVGAASAPEITVSLLEQALHLYRGALLADLYDDWIVQERNQLSDLHASGLAQLARAQQATGDLRGAVHTARHLLELDPLEEATHQHLMELYYLSGDRARALQQYEQYCRVLKEQLSVEPLPETQRLHRAMLDGNYRPSPFQTGRRTPPVATARPGSKGSLQVPFVGRQAELARLTNTWEQSRDGTLQMVIITGDSGQGKTRLVLEWVNRLPPDVIHLQGCGHEFEQTISYRPLLDALQQSLHLVPWEALPPSSTHAWLAPLAQLLPDLYYYLPDLAGPATLLDEESSHPVIEGVAQLLLNLARRQPVVLFLDDLHWADPGTWRFLNTLSRRSHHPHLLVVGTFSTSEATNDAWCWLRAVKQKMPTEEIPLSRLWLDDIARLISRMLVQPVDDVSSLARWLHQISDGNPFFAVEYIRALLDSGGPGSYTPNHLDKLRLPTAIKALIENRLDHVEEESLFALSVAAVIGRDFTFELLLQCSKMAEGTLLGYLEDWLVRGLVSEQAEDRYDFTHPHIREVTYQRLSRPRRQRLHYQVACALKRSQPVDIERVAYHYQHSHRPERAIPALLAAGRRALNTHSYPEARRIGQIVLGICRQIPEARSCQHELELNLQLALAYSFAGSTEDALRHLEDASALAEALDDAAQGSEVALRIAQIYWVREAAPTARRHAERALALVQLAPDPAREAAVLRLLGRIAVAQGHFAIAVPYLTKALAQNSSLPRRATTLGYLATAHGHLGRAEEAVATAEDALVLARRLGSPPLLAMVHVQAAVTYNILNMWPEAQAMASQGLRDAVTHELDNYAFIARSVLGRVLHHQGKSREAWRLLEEAIEWAEAHDYLLFRYLAHVHLAEVAQDVGDLQSLQEQIGKALELANRTGNQWVKTTMSHHLESAGCRVQPASTVDVPATKGERPSPDGSR